MLYEPFAASAWVLPELKKSAGVTVAFLETRSLLGLPEISTEKIAAFGHAIGLEEKEDPRRWWETFREVDEAMLESDDEREFFLSHLSEKTRRRLSTYRDAYREHFGELAPMLDAFFADAELPAVDEIWLVPRLATPTRFLEHLQQRLELSVTVPVSIASWTDLFVGKARRPVTLEGPSALLWERLARRAKRRTSRGQVGIAFQGNQADRFALRLALAREGLRLREEWLPNDEPLTPNPWSAWRQIRQSRQLPWPRRLGVETQYRELEDRRVTSHETTAERLTEELTAAGILQTEEIERWNTELPAAAVPRASWGEVFLLPPQLYPPVPNMEVLYFVNPLCPPARPSALGSWEKEQLWDAGFPLPLPVSLTGDPPSAPQRTIWFRLPSTISVTGTRKLTPRPDNWYRGQWDRTFSAPAVLSASGLDAFQECPAYYFFSRKLKLQRKEPLWEQGSLVYGSLAHGTLDEWITGDKTPARAEAIFHQLTEEKFPGLSEGHPLRLFLKDQIESLAPQLPNMEAALSVLFGQTTVLGREVMFELDIDGGRFTGRIDRVDRLANGSLLVIDYKTGNVGFSPDHMADGRDHQSILYALAAEKIYQAPVGAFLYYDLKLREVRRGIVRKELLDKDGIKALTRGHAVEMERWATLHANALTHLSELVAQIHSGDWRPNPGAQCADCEYLAPCRRGQPWQS